MNDIWMSRKIILCSALGTALEWYDFFIFGVLSVLLSKKFFPHDGFSSLINTFGIFTVGFIARPLGGIIWGYIGDTLGRKKALLYSILIMSFSTAFIGLITNYNQLGITILVILRIAQGLSASGEHAGALILVNETFPNMRNSFYSSFCLSGIYLGMVLANVVPYVVITLIGDQAFNDWGWRIPFFASILLGLIGYYLRTGILETPAFEKMLQNKEALKIPIIHLLKTNWRNTLLGIGIFQLAVTVPYIIFIFYPSYAKFKFTDFSNIFSLIMICTLIPFFGYLATIKMRAKLMVSTAVLILMFSAFLISKIEQVSMISISTTQIIYSLFISAFVGSLGSFIVELFPIQVRYTGLAISLNFAATFFGGTAPLIMAFLLSKGGEITNVGYYLIMSSLLALLVMSLFYKTVKQ